MCDIGAYVQGGSSDLQLHSALCGTRGTTSSQDALRNVFPADTFPRTIKVVLLVHSFYSQVNACSSGSPDFIACYFLNTSIMYFIRISCRSLSVPLYPITPRFLFCSLWRRGLRAQNTQLAFCCRASFPVFLLFISCSARNSIILAVRWCRCRDTQWRTHYLICWQPNRNRTVLFNVHESSLSLWQYFDAHLFCSKLPHNLQVQ